MIRILLVAVALVPAFALAADFKPDPGFKPLLTGSTLDGWKLQKGGESLDGKAEAAKKRFVLADGVLVVDPKVKGDVIIETAQKFADDVTVKFEFKPGKGCNNDLYLRGVKFDLKAGDVKWMKEGEWNTFEIAVVGEKAEVRCNGEPVKTLKTKPGATPFGLRAEFGPIEYRNLQIKAAE